ARIVLVHRAFRHKVGAGLATEVVAIALLCHALLAIAADHAAAAEHIELASERACQARGVVRPVVQTGPASEVRAIAGLNAVHDPVAAPALNAQAALTGSDAEFGQRTGLALDPAAARSDQQLRNATAPIHANTALRAQQITALDRLALHACAEQQDHNN